MSIIGSLPKFETQMANSPLDSSTRMSNGHLKQPKAHACFFPLKLLLPSLSHPVTSNSVLAVFQAQTLSHP